MTIVKLSRLLLSGRLEGLLGLSTAPSSGLIMLCGDSGLEARLFTARRSAAESTMVELSAERSDGTGRPREAERRGSMREPSEENRAIGEMSSVWVWRVSETGGCTPAGREGRRRGERAGMTGGGGGDEGDAVIGLAVSDRFATRPE